MAAACSRAHTQDHRFLGPLPAPATNVVAAAFSTAPFHRPYTSRALVLILLVGVAPLLLASVGVALARAIDRLRERRRHARVLTDLGAPVLPAAAFGVARREVVTIEGKLVAIAEHDDDQDASNARIVSFHPYGTSFLDEVNVYAITHSKVPKSFAIELDGGVGRAIIDGSCQVVRGAIETEHTAPLEKGAIALDAEPLSRLVKVKKRVAQFGQFRIVKPGDRVRARGALLPAPDDDALYRARSNVLRMTPPSSDDNNDDDDIDRSLGEPQILIAATTTSRRRRIEPSRGVFVALGASTVIGAVLAIVAQRTGLPSRLHQAQKGEDASSKTDASMTTAPPACRAEVLGKLSKYEIGDVQSCNDSYARAMADYASGDFASASEEFTAAALANPSLVPTLTEVEAHLFAPHSPHSFDEAANVVRRMNDQFYPGPSTTEKRHLECILEVLSERAKAPADKKPRFVKVCSSTRAFLKLARELDSEGMYRGEDDWPRPTYQQDTRYDAVGETFTAVITPRARLTARPVGIERDLLDRLLLQGSPPGWGPTPFGKLEIHHPYDAGDVYVVLSTWAAELTLFYAYAGFPERSAPYWPILDHVADVLGADKSFHRRIAPSLIGGPTQLALENKAVDDEHTLLTFVMAIAGAAALYSNDPVRMTRYTSLGEPYSSQASRQMSRLVLPKSVWEDPVVDRAWPEHKAVFDAALSGDVAAVVRVLTEQHANGRTTLSRALPQLGTSADRGPLVRWFHSDAYPAACLTCGASTFLGDISDRREVARVLGDTPDERDRLRPIAERFTTALTDVAIGFEVDELETFFVSKKK